MSYTFSLHSLTNEPQSFDQIMFSFGFFTQCVSVFYMWVWLSIFTEADTVRIGITRHKIHFFHSIRHKNKTIVLI